MRPLRRALRCALAGAALFPALAAAQLPPSALAVDIGGKWQEWWRSSAAPATWPDGHPLIAAALRWRPASPGIDVAELRLTGSGEAWRVRAIVVRVAPRLVALRPVFGGADSLGSSSWRVSEATAADIALNAGQFSGRRPWGWIVRDAREIQAPGFGPLSSALVIQQDGGLQVIHAESLSSVRRSTTVTHAFQSYPTLLKRGEIPAQLLTEKRGVDLRHRDGRLAVGMLRDSKILIVLTRFEALGGTLDLLPFGLTTPEMAALMGALGCRDAMLLDGGISGQLLVRTPEEVKSWPGLRAVPMGLVGTRRK